MSGDSLSSTLRGNRFARAKRLLVLLISFVLVALATRWLSLVVDVFDIDETCHIVGAWQLLRGGLLYTDFVDNKPPLVYAYYAVTQLLAGRGLFGVHLVTAACVIPLTALAVSSCYRHTRVGVVAAFTFLIYSAAFIGHDMLAANAEVLMVLPAAWAIVLLRDAPRVRDRRRVFAAGLLLGLSALCKPQVGAWIAAVVVVLVWHATGGGTWRDGAKLVAALLPGVLVPVVAACAYFWARGGLGAMLYWTAINDVSYAGNPIGLEEGAARFASMLVPFLAVTAPLWIAWRRGRDLLEPAYWRVLVSGLVIASLPPAFLGFRFFPHYFIQLYVPLALASGPWLELQLRRPIRRAGRFAIAWSAVVVVGFAVANAALYQGPFRVYQERDPRFREVARRVRTDSCARGGSMFVWGWAPMIYYFADVPPASRFVVLAPSRLTGYVAGNLASNRGEAAEGRVVPEHWTWLMDDLKRRRATFVIDTAPANVYRWGRYPLTRYPRLMRYVQSEFALAGDVGGIRIYRRRGCAAAAGVAVRR